MPKINGLGKAEIIPTDVLKEILADPEIKLKYRALIAVLFFTAGRISEVCALKLSDITFHHITFAKSITKTKKTRQVVIHEQLKPILEEYIKSLPLAHVYLFPSRDYGQHYSRFAASKMLDKIFERYGLIGCSTHSLRRSMLTIAHRMGNPLADIQQLSGHSSLTSLQSYLQCHDNAQSRVLDSVKL